MDLAVAVILTISLILAYGVARHATSRPVSPASVRAGDHTEHEVAPVYWDFTKSWASDAAVLVALYQLLFGFGLLPETGTLLDSSRYALLAVCFAGLVPLAPLFYLTFATYVQDPVTGAVVPIGTIGTLRIAVIMTLWAIAGQALIAVLLAVDLITDATHSRLLIVSVAILNVAICFYGFRYGHRAMRYVAETSVSAVNQLLSLVEPLEGQARQRAIEATLASRRPFIMP